MRNLEYLSPSSIASYKKNQEEFYLIYLSEIRAPRFAQTQPMSIGSAFDAYAKSFLHEALFGKGFDPKFDFETIFVAQVEEQNRDWAKINGAEAFAAYKRSGALADLMLELQTSIETPRFEFEVKGVVNGEREGITKTVGHVVLLGKPDVFYINKWGIHVILDFKVNGWCSKASPMRGYMRLRPGSGQNILQGPHKDCMAMAFKNTMINCGMFLENANEEWANQLATYGWLCGCPIGGEFIVAIDQLACKSNPGLMPEVRVAEHRLRISKDYQWKFFEQAQNLWNLVHSDHIFRDMSYEDSKSKCELLDAQAKQLVDNDDPIFNAMTRG